MTLHELKYCQHLVRRLKDLYIERAALTTILDTPRLANAPASDWRVSKELMTSDPVFRSAVEANFAPLFERITAAMKDERALKDLATAAQ